MSRKTSETIGVIGSGVAGFAFGYWVLPILVGFGLLMSLSCGTLLLIMVFPAVLKCLIPIGGLFLGILGIIFLGSLAGVNFHAT